MRKEKPVLKIHKHIISNGSTFILCKGLSRVFCKYTMDDSKVTCKECLKLMESE